MAKHKRNKRYAPKYDSNNGNAARVLQLLQSVDNSMPIPPLRMTDLGIAFWAAFHQMLHGSAREEDWTTVTVSLNVALILAEKIFQNDHVPYIVKALDGAMRSKLRAKGLNVWRYDGTAICAIREALEIHDEQIKIATQAEIHAAFNEVLRRRLTGHVYPEAA